MKIWNTLSLFIVVIVLAGGIVFLMRSNVANQPPLASPQPEVTDTSAIEQKVQLNLFLQPEQTPIKVGEETTFSVDINSGELGVSIVDSNFTYDTSRISIVSLDPGPFFKQPLELKQNIDTVAGVVSYAVGSRSFSQGEGAVFKIKVKALAETEGIANIFSFDRESTEVGVRDLAKKRTYYKPEIALIFEELPLAILP